ncbi:acyl carrier protein [Belnapia sp. T6]|uniref:Acyl carrier protein n=1 Tax=Belnapia mucosa TaxID=2804532 RepID=A0ABS1VAR1_9PROT|nr:acyl carrier protein [Belnapia mucosa]MBL6457819.1 acyl carrier protein [Belnapia mucosa]
MAASLEELYEVLASALNAWNVQFRPEMGARDVPGWDSMHHMMLILEVNDRFGVDLSPEATAELPDIAALLAAIQAAQQGA